MKLVEAAEEYALLYDVKPTSLLIMDLGSVLTQGSVTLKSSLLSLRPEIPERLTKIRSDVHTELVDGLAAPQKIILVTSQLETARSSVFYTTDFTQNIRHKFLIVVLAMLPTKAPVSGPAIFLARTIVWSRNRKESVHCMDNYGNLFIKEGSRQYPLACDLNVVKCTTTEVRSKMFDTIGQCGLTIFVRVKCNATEFENIYDVRNRWALQNELIYLLASRGTVLERRWLDCYAFILVNHIDVTALLKPFELDAWLLILTTAATLAVAWSTMARKSFFGVLGHIFVSMITGRDFDFRPKKCANTMIGCVTLAFIFFTAQLYSNIVMSSFLDPTLANPPSLFSLNCRWNPWCQNVTRVEEILGIVGLCAFPMHLLAQMSRPLRLRHEVHRHQMSEHLEASRYSNTRALRQFPVVLTQECRVIDRIIEHGVISFNRQMTVENAHRRVRVDPDPVRSRGTYEGTIRALKRHAYARKADTHLATHSSVVGDFDMEGFIKLQPLVALCVVLIVGCWCLELCWVRRSAFATEFLRFLARLRGNRRDNKSNDERGLSSDQLFEKVPRIADTIMPSP